MKYIGYDYIVVENYKEYITHWNKDNNQFMHCFCFEPEFIKTNNIQFPFILKRHYSCIRNHTDSYILVRNELLQEFYNDLHKYIEHYNSRLIELKELEKKVR